MKTVIHVGSDKGRPDPRLDSFPTIAEALSSARAIDAGALEIRLHEGRYRGHISVNKPLTIAGMTGRQDRTILTGSIVNSRGSPLVLEDFMLGGSSDCRIVQAGGTLHMRNLVLTETTEHRHAAVPSRADARISVTKGAMVVAKDVLLSMNQNPVISVSGQNTRVILSGVLMKDNRAPSFDSVSSGDANIFGAIDVAGGATLLIENSLVLDNDFIGVCIHEGSRMHLRSSTVTGTKRVDTPTGPAGGINIFIRAEAVVELNCFLVSCAQLAGIHINGGYLTAENGQVRDNRVGISVINAPNDSSYDLFKCAVTGVSYYNNERNLDADRLPVPESSSTPASCPRVPWIEG
jgi:nitrous oxidase accessory protein NosD